MVIAPAPIYRVTLTGENSELRRATNPMVALAFFAVALGVASTTLAQDKPGNFTRRVVPLLPDLSNQISTQRQPADPNAPAKLCFWKSTDSGTAFVQSGFCDVPSGMAVGAACRCSSNSIGRPNGKWLGTVMLAPSGDGTTPVVR